MSHTSSSGPSSTAASSQMTLAQSQHFLLKWNNHRSNLVTVFENLLQGENLVDVTLAVEGKFLKAHKIVLSACSPYFQSMFVHQTPNEKHPIIIFHDLKFSHLKTLLEFMYRGEISIDEKDLSEILKVAEALSIRGLSSFESEEEESTEPSDKPEPEPSSGTSPAVSSTVSTPPTPKLPNPTSPNDNQPFYGHQQPVCDASNGNGIMELDDIDTEPPPTNTKPIMAARGQQKRTKAKPNIDPKTGLTIKKKRGRQPKNTVSSASVELRPPILKPHEPFVTDVKPVLTGKPISTVRRRIPKKYGVKREKLSQATSTTRGAESGSVYRRQFQVDDDSPDSPSTLELNEPLSEGRLTEMSVRGLDLFRYASVEDGVYRCMECEKLHIKKSFKNKYSFQRHAFLYHEGNMRKVFPCSVCSREFSRPDKMKNHLRSIHQAGNGKEFSPTSDGSENSTPIGIASKITDSDY